MNAERREGGVRRTITEVRLANFKSVKQQRVRLRPLTIIVGANSSGKSTLMQAILLMAQTTSTRSADPDVPLNGDFVNLGFLDDVRHGRPRNGTDVNVGLTIEFQPNRRTAMYWWYPYADQFDDTPTSVPWFADVDFGFGAERGTDVVMAPLRSLVMRSGPLDPALGGATTARVKFGRQREGADLDRLGTFAPTATAFGVGNSVPCTGSLQRDGEGAIRVVGIRLNGAVPFEFVRLRPASVALAEAFLHHLVRRRIPSFVDEEDASKRTMDVDQLVDVAASLLVDYADDPSTNLQSYLRERLTSDIVRGVTVELVLEHRSEIIRKLATALGRGRGRLPIAVQAAEVGLSGIGARGVSDALGSLKHLGGLRAAPQPLYPTSPQAQRGEIGRDGAFTAAVLYALRDRQVASFDEDGNPEDMSLFRAVEQWAGRLGLFQAVDTHHRGALGFDIAVKPEGMTDHIDITAVGLGVSQLLPVIVRCLLSEPDAVILLEQPELHLHPESQQRLADFLLACSRSGRQLIVETHSEHLVNRVRRRAATDPTSEVADLVALVFAERDRNDGSTTYRNVDVNPFGGLSEWPDGFMTSGIHDVQALLDEGLSKLERERNRTDSTGV